jgi:hypothetical protein
MDNKLNTDLTKYKDDYPLVSYENMVDIFMRPYIPYYPKKILLKYDHNKYVDEINKFGKRVCKVPVYLVLIKITSMSAFKVDHVPNFIDTFSEKAHNIIEIIKTKRPAI